MLLLPIITEARPMEMANFRKLFRREGEISSAVASNNIEECAPSVRRAIRRAKNKWGIFHFACINGLVRNVFVDPKSKVNMAPASFISDNLGLFDLHTSSITVKFQGDKGLEYFGDVLVSGTEIFRVTRPGAMPVPESQGAARPVSTRDLERAAGVIKGEFVVFELGLVDPEDLEPKNHPGIKGPL